MTTRTQHVAVTGPSPALEIRNPSGSVTVEARDGAGEVVVEVTALDPGAESLLDRVEISASPGQVRVTVPERRLFRAPSFAVRVTTPAGADTRVETASANARLSGRLGRVRLATASGDATVDDCAGLKLRTASGDARVGSVDGHVTVGSASGNVTVDRAGDGLDVRTASGDVSVGESSGDVSVGTASGDVSVGDVRSGAVRVRTASGDVELGVSGGLRVWLDLSSMSGRMESSLREEGADDGSAEPAQVSLSLRSMSGSLLVRRAAPSR